MSLRSRAGGADGQGWWGARADGERSWWGWGTGPGEVGEEDWGGLGGRAGVVGNRMRHGWGVGPGTVEEQGW